MVVYHKYKADSHSSTWVLVAASASAKLDLDKYLKGCTDVTTLNPFEIHVILVDTALANWRPRIVDLTEEITHQVSIYCLVPISLAKLTIMQSNRVLVADIGSTNSWQLLDVEERQKLKESEDQIIDILAVLTSTADTISSMIQNYNEFCQDFSAPLKSTSDIKLDLVHYALQEKLREVHLNQEKVKALHVKVQGTISLVCSFLKSQQLLRMNT